MHAKNGCNNHFTAFLARWKWWKLKKNLTLSPKKNLFLVFFFWGKIVHTWVSYCGLVAPLLEPFLREDLRNSRGGVRETRRSSSNTRRRSKTTRVSQQWCALHFYGFLWTGLSCCTVLWLFMDDSFLKHSFFYGFLWTTLSWSTLSFVAFYGRLFLLWLFMDDSFLKGSFFYGFLWTTLSWSNTLSFMAFYLLTTHPFCGLLMNNSFPSTFLYII